MPRPRRPRRQSTDDWQQLRLLVTSPEQEAYELVRPIVLFGQPPNERARETGVSAATLRRKAARVATQGLLGLFAQDPSPDRDQRRLPPEIRHAIIMLKAQSPPFSLREIAAICRTSLRRPVDHQTVGRVLGAEPLPLDPPRRCLRYHEMPDPVQRRKAIVDLYHDGWSPRAIAGSLATSRARVQDVLKRWDEEGGDGLPDRSRAPRSPARKVDLTAMATIRRLQENPELGEFRIHAALEQVGIHLSPRTCGAILALHRALGAPHPDAPIPHAPQPMPFAAARWRQQNDIETMFSIMRRMADYDFARAETWAELQAAHDRFVTNDNHQPHFAHSGQPAGRRSPAAVLTWVTGRVCDPAERARIFRLREPRRIRTGGTIRYRHWRLYGERGIAGATAAVWLDDETLTIEHAMDTLAQDRVAYETDRHHLHEVSEPRLDATRAQVPQPFLPLLEASPWQPAQRLARDRPRRQRAAIGDQAPLFPWALAASLD